METPASCDARTAPSSYHRRNAGTGALIGCAVGAGGGYLYGKHKESEQATYQQGYQAAKRAQ